MMNGQTKPIAIAVGILTLLGGMTTALFYIWETRSVAEDALEDARKAREDAIINRSILLREHPEHVQIWRNGR